MIDESRSPLHDVVVVGAGSAGLACAWRLHKAGLDVLVLESRDRPGGNVHTDIVDGFRLERGPHTIMASADAVFDLAEEVGLGDAITPTRPESEDRFIARNGRIHAMPVGAWSFLTTDLLSWGSKLTLATEPLRLKRGQETDTATDFFTRRFGPEAARVLAGAFISGVYAGDPDLLSAPAAFPLFWGFEQETGSMILGAMKYMRRKKPRAGPVRKGLYSFAEGLGMLTRTTAERLAGRCLLDTQVTEVIRRNGSYDSISEKGVFRSRALVVATPPKHAGFCLRNLDPTLAEDIAEIPLSPVAMVQLGYRRRLPEIPEGFGFLVPRGEGIRSLGVLFPSRLFDGRAPDGGDLLTGFVGGLKDPEALDLDDDVIAQIVRDDLRALTGLGATPDLVEVRRYPQAIPQFVLGHNERMARIRERLLSNPGCFLAGNYTIGVGLKDATRAGFEASDACRKWIEGASP